MQFCGWCGWVRRNFPAGLQLVAKKFQLMLLFLDLDALLFQLPGLLLNHVLELLKDIADVGDSRHGLNENRAIASRREHVRALGGIGCAGVIRSAKRRCRGYNSGNYRVFYDESHLLVPVSCSGFALLRGLLELSKGLGINNERGFTHLQFRKFFGKDYRGARRTSNRRDNNRSRWMR